jgi:hypothetical protein
MNVSNSPYGHQLLAYILLETHKIYLLKTSKIWRILYVVNTYFNKSKNNIVINNILYAISKRKANWIAHILRRNCLLKQVIEGKIKGGIEVTGRRGRRRGKLLGDLKERRRIFSLERRSSRYHYVESSLWKKKDFGPVLRQTTK